mgnify:CR=1 FL=1
MHWSQYLVAGIYAAVAALAFRRGSIAPAVACIFAANFAGMVLADGDLNWMIVVDGLCIAALIYDHSAMALGLAYAFIATLVIEAGGNALGLQFNTTSAIVDAMIVPIALIIGWSNGGGGRLDFAMGRNDWWAVRRDRRRHLSLVAQYNAMFDMAGHHDADRGAMTNGKR